VCLSLAAFPHYCTDPDVTCGNGSCALLGGFAIGARCFVAATTQHEREMSVSACTRPVAGLIGCGFVVDFIVSLQLVLQLIHNKSNKWSSAYTWQVSTATRCATHVVLYTKLDAQCDKLATVVDRTKLTTRATVDVP